MLALEKVFDSDSNKPLTKESDLIRALFDSEEYKSVRTDRVLFDYFYRETAEGCEGWT
jgi:hypothetical protein